MCTRSSHPDVRVRSFEFVQPIFGTVSLQQQVFILQTNEQIHRQVVFHYILDLKYRFVKQNSAPSLRRLGYEPSGVQSPSSERGKTSQSSLKVFKSEILILFNFVLAFFLHILFHASCKMIIWQQTYNIDSTKSFGQYEKPR